MTPAEAIVANILADLANRRGLGHEWDRINSATQVEIAEALVKITQSVLDGEVSAQGFAAYFTLDVLRKNVAEDDE